MIWSEFGQHSLVLCAVAGSGDGPDGDLGASSLVSRAESVRLVALVALLAVRGGSVTRTRGRAVGRARH
jgi:hypothetical protein